MQTPFEPLVCLEMSLVATKSEKLKIKKKGELDENGKIQPWSISQCPLGLSCRCVSHAPALRKIPAHVPQNTPEETAT